MVGCSVENCKDEADLQCLYNSITVKYYCNNHYNQHGNGSGKPYDQNRVKEIIMPALEAYVERLNSFRVEMARNLMGIIVYVENLMSEINKRISKDKYEIDAFIDTIKQGNPQLNEYYKFLLFKDEDELKEYLKLDLCYPKFTCEANSIHLLFAQVVHLFDGSLINLHKDSETVIVNLLDYLSDIPNYIERIPLYAEVTEKVFVGNYIDKPTLDIVTKVLDRNGFAITIGKSGILSEDKITQVPYGQIYKLDTFYQGELYDNRQNGFGLTTKEPKTLYTGFYYEGQLRGMFIIDKNDGYSKTVGFNYGNNLRRSDPIPLIFQSNYLRPKIN